jgi:cytochrome c-type biogenesis protein
METVSYLAAFGAGLASFVAPCVLPLVPIYLASLAGPEILEPGAKIRRLPLVIHSLSFVIGFTLVYTVIGALAGMAGIVISPFSPVVQKVTGSLLIVFGLFMLASLKIPWLNFEKRLSPPLGMTGSYLRSFLIGGTFSIAWVPCLSGIAGSVFAFALNSDTAWQGASLLASYSLGLGLPFLITGAAFSFIGPLLKRIYRYSKWVYIISGILLVTVGVLVMTNNLAWISG